ncbi:PREDICTED: uncharacterized protein LOC104766922 [Camelina sativa]|uniref:Uncharacterized protein LOC104766922 n=1 Tax=Camelina sativa TaxID=90675 RepID=A0ABM0XQ16_CAMSA|nr:PREDICTED: uncharacterized protein LOC104766922 [Camelina sativa]
MASPTNKNPSFSPPIPNRPNPKPRNSEAGDPLRRSFGGNPFPAITKVNIPSEFTRRNSFGGEDKENETKAVTTPKASKNFMSPTISAVSKINPSPRKRVLSDKNDMSRSFSDVKGLILEDYKRSHHRAKSCVSFSDVIHSICIDEKMQFEGSHDMTVTDFDEKEVYENKGITYSDPRFRISPRPSVPYASPEFAAREVDTTLLPPYDPKKNYLSPRPQFLHYKPNPRIEKRYDECKQLEELFISESSSSETELSVEESDTCEEQDKDGAETVVEDEIEDLEQLEAESDQEMVCESVKETRQIPKQSGFRKFKFLGWFLALAMACLLVSMTFSPLMISTFNEFHIPQEITEFAKANNLDELSEKFWTLTESSLVYMDKLISSLGGGNEEYGQLQFHNFTYTLEDNTVSQPTSVEINEEPLQEKSTVETNLLDVNGEDGSVNVYGEDVYGEAGSVNEEPLQEKSTVETNLLDVYGEDGSVNVYGEDVYGEDGSVNGSELKSGGEEKSDGDAETNESDEQTEVRWNTDIELSATEENLKALSENGFKWNTEEQRESEVSPKEKLETGSSKKDQEKLEEDVSDAIYINQHVESFAINLHQQKESEILAAESGSEEEDFGEIGDDLLHLEVSSSNKADNDLAKADAKSGTEEAFGETAAETSDELHPEVSSDNDSVKVMIVLSSTVLALLAAVAYIYVKKVKPVAVFAPEPAAETIIKDVVPVENLTKEKLSSLNFKAEEVDDRMSNSFHKKSSFHKEPQSEGGKKNNNNSSSSKLRRESMASSASEYSVGSFSYGSFTTYEKIPIKSGDREEEMITPVRRSSRIRNKPSGV